jgi:hypothetical protein
VSSLEFIVAMVTATPALLASIAAFYHSVISKSALEQRVSALENQSPS